MDFLMQIVDIFLHVDKHLKDLIDHYGAWTYGILFLIIFMETGFVVTPFLPGDSLLFAAGAFAALGSFDFATLFFLLWFAAVAGDNVNYWIGRTVGKRAFHMENNKFFKKEYLDKTQAFYNKHGGKTLVIARFMPIVRTFAPFVAGVGKMEYPRFLAFSVGGGLLWMGIFISAGYFFGNLPFVKDNLKVVLVGIIAVSVLPAVIEALKHRARSRAGTPPAQPAE